MLWWLAWELSSPKCPRIPSVLRRETRPHKKTAPSAVPTLATLALRHKLGLEENDLECLTWLVPQEPRILCTSCPHTATSKFSLRMHDFQLFVWESLLTQSTLTPGLQVSGHNDTSPYSSFPSVPVLVIWLWTEMFSEYADDLDNKIRLYSHSLGPC